MEKLTPLTDSRLQLEKHTWPKVFARPLFGTWPDMITLAVQNLVLQHFGPRGCTRSFVMLHGDPARETSRGLLSIAVGKSAVGHQMQIVCIVKNLFLEKLHPASTVE